MANNRFRMFDSADSAGLWFDIFNGVLLLGAFFVLVGTWGTIKTSAIKERFADERTAANEAETKRAIADSDAAKEATAKADLRIAELSTQAEGLRKDTAQANARALEAQVALETFKAPRALSPEQQAAISEKIKPFAGQEYAFAVSPTIDALSLMEEIDTALQGAGWVRVAPLGAVVVGGAAVAYFKSSGVRVQVAKSRNADIGPVATLLAEALTDQGIVAASAMSPDVDVRPTAMQIVIGIKPQ
jgi:hypothetical protein